MKSSKDALRIARQLLKLTLVDGRVDQARARKIVAKVAAEKPRGYLGILTAYGKQIRLELAKRHAVIESAVGLTATVQNGVSSDLKNKYGDDLTFEFAVHPDLIGGMRVKVGSDVWDGSVKARLARLSDLFK